MNNINIKIILEILWIIKIYANHFGEKIIMNEFVLGIFSLHARVYSLWVFYVG